MKVDTESFSRISKGNLFQNVGADTEKALEAVFGLIFGMDKRCFDVERRLRMLVSGLSMLHKYDGSLNKRDLKVRSPSLNLILYRTGSQCSDFNNGLERENLGDLVTILAKQF